MEDSNIDKYTGLFSRAYALSSLEDLIAQAQEGKRVGMIFIDIDFFARFNCGFGHLEGDKMLWGLARMMENVIGHDGVISRYSGDEFLIIVPNAGTAETLELAERLRTEAADVTLELNGNTVGPLTLTIGVACFPDDGASLTELIEAADLAVYAGKWRGKNCVISARDIQASKEN